MITVIKRTGERVDYDGTRIQNAVKNALVATGEVTDMRVDLIPLLLSTLVEEQLTQEHPNKKDFDASVEHIQDLVECTLMKQGLYRTAKEYILYRSQHAKVRDQKAAVLDVKQTIESYVGPNKDWRVKENATVSLSLGGLILSNSSAITANYWLNEVYDNEIAVAHKSASLHIHDLGMLSGYCAGWSLKQLIQEGLGGVEGRISSSPASHLSTLCAQAVNFLGVMQNEWAGAQAFSSFDTYLAPFVKKDNLSYKEVKQCLQSFVYGVNTPSRWGTQPPFTNITLDWVIPADMKNLPAIVGGKEMPFTYGDCQHEVDMVNKAFLDIMLHGDANGRGFQYPIPTYSITKDFDWSNTENNRLLFEMTAKYGTPYFSNYINSDMEPSDVRSMCCRLRLDLRELRKKAGGYFGAGESTGSIGVVTLNLPQIAYLSSNEDAFLLRLDRLMDTAARSLNTKRTVINRLLDEGLYPYTKRYLGSFSNHFSTIGIVGMNEAARNACWLHTDLTTDEGQAFAKRVLTHMRTRLQDYQEKYGDLFNLEATPAESTSYRFAKHDKLAYPDIITAAEEGETPFYTNSSHIPVGATDDIFDALDLQDELQVLYNSGTVFHAFLGEKLPSWESAAALVKKIAENYHLPYYTLSPTYSVCRNHGYLAGEKWTCPYCGEKTEVYSRITGYYRPLQNWNEGKSQEYQKRTPYSFDKLGTRPMHENPSADTSSADNAKCPAEMDSSPILVTTSTCPNCIIAKRALQEAGVVFNTVVADKEPEQVRKLCVQTAPTLILPQKDGEYLRIMNASNIIAWARTHGI